MPHGNDVALADEEVGLAERDSAVHELRGSRNDEEAGLELFELGALVSLAGILNRERVKIELGLDLVEQRGAGFVQSDPDDVARAARPLAGLGQTDVRNAPSIDVRTGRDHAEIFVSWNKSVWLSHSDIHGVTVPAQN